MVRGWRFALTRKAAALARIRPVLLLRAWKKVAPFIKEVRRVVGLRGHVIRIKVIEWVSREYADDAHECLLGNSVCVCVCLCVCVCVCVFVCVCVRESVQGRE